MHGRYVTVRFDGVWSRVDRGWATGSSLSFHIKWPTWGPGVRIGIRDWLCRVPAYGGKTPGPGLDYCRLLISKIHPIRSLSLLRGRRGGEGGSGKKSLVFPTKSIDAANKKLLQKQRTLIDRIAPEVKLAITSADVRSRSFKRIRSPYLYIEYRQLLPRLFVSFFLTFKISKASRSKILC